MRIMTIFKWINILFIAVFGLIGLGGYVYFSTVCGEHNCSEWLLDSWLTSLIWGNFGIAAISLILLPFPSRIFKLWLIYIFSWGFPLSLYMISQINIQSSHVFAIGRGEAALFLSYIFGAITIIYIAGYYALLWRRGRHVSK